MSASVAVIATILYAAAAQAQEIPPDDEIARRHFDQGRSYYAVGRYDDALEEFEAARRVRPVAALDFNVARCLDRMERFGDAIGAYQRYVQGNPKAIDADEVRERIRVLRTRLAAMPSPVPLVVRAPPPKPTVHRRSVIAIVTTIGIAALSAVAVGLGVGLHRSAEPDPATFGIHRGTP
jgi:tetratricopeptide (TPR) repeat protein